MPMPMMTKKRHAKKAEIKTELGIKIETTETFREAEYCAKLKEELEAKATTFDNGIDRLLEQMKLDKVSRVKVRGPSGTLYEFEAQAVSERIKITKPKI